MNSCYCYGNKTKAVGFSKARQSLNNIFVMHYGDIKN